MVKIKYVPKSTLYPAFGLFVFKGERIYIRKRLFRGEGIYIREDLPKVVRKFLIEHEIFHLEDWKRLQKKKKKDNWIWSEIKANAYGTIKQPIGAFVCIIMSLTPARFKLYLNRFKAKW